MKNHKYSIEGVKSEHNKDFKPFFFATIEKTVGILVL